MGDRDTQVGFVVGLLLTWAYLEGRMDSRKRPRLLRADSRPPAELMDTDRRSCGRECRIYGPRPSDGMLFCETHGRLIYGTMVRA